MGDPTAAASNLVSLGVPARAIGPGGKLLRPTACLMFFEPYFRNEDAAYSFVEERLWPDGPVCPHCRCTGKKVGKLEGKTTRRGLYKCYGCRRPFTVKIGTTFESSHIQLHLWLQAIYLLSCSNRKVTVRQLQQTLGIALRTAWVLNSRIRETIARDDGPLAEIGEPRAEGETMSAPQTTGAVEHTAVASGGAYNRVPLGPPEVAVANRELKREERKRRAREVQHNPKQINLLLGD